MKKTLFSLLFSAGVLLSAAQLKDFTPYDTSKASKVILSDSFESKHPQLKNLSKDYHIKRGYGQNATGGLMLKRAPGAKYSFPYYKLDLKPGTRYHFSVDIRATGLVTSTGKIASNRRIALAGMDFSNNEKWVKANYAYDKPVNGEIKWRTHSIEFFTPDKFTDAKFAMFLKKDLACEAVYWDNVVIKELGETPPVIFPTLPKNLHPDDEGNIKVRVHDFNKNRSEKQLLLFAEINGKEFCSKLENGFAFFKIGKLAIGEHKLKLYLADCKSKSIIGVETYPLFATGKKAPAGTVTTAEDSRILVDGKPFFPLGFFVERPQRLTKKRLAKLKKVGVNTILPYGSMKMTLGKSSGKIGLDSVRKSLDYLHKNDMKVIFSLLEVTGTIRKKIPVYDGITDQEKQAEHLVSVLWNHPAILSWYVSDENPPSELGPIRSLRHIVNRLDPFHPAATLTDQKENYVYFGPTGDLLMTDRYPIMYRSEPQSMSSVHACLERALTDGHLGNWFVPQCFNWGLYRRNEKFATFRFPSELEIRSQCLAALNHRVRGIIFYAYDSIIRQESYGPEGAYKKQWPKTANVVKLLKELEPFFLSLEKPVEVKVESKGDSRVEAWRHSADGKEIVVITSDGPGKGDAVIDAGRTGLKSRFGFSKEIGGGKYQFNSVEIASDILE